MKLNDKQKILGVFGILSLVLIAVGVSVAFFTYSKDGITENTIKSGSITFLYDEINQSGNSIGITDALPISDTQGKAQTNYFNFKIVSNSSNTNTIPYEITLRQKQGTDNIGNKVKVYLSKIDSYNSAVNTEEEVVTSMFSDLTTVTHNNYSEKLLHTDIVPASDTRYEQYYRLKMWLDESATLSSTEETFTVTVNVYSNGHVLDAASSDASINSIMANNTELIEKNINGDSVYVATFPEGTSRPTLTVESGEYTTVRIIKTKYDYTTPVASTGVITRLSTSKVVSLKEGANYFKIISSSEDGTETKETHAKIVSGEEQIARVNYRILGVDYNYEIPEDTDVIQQISHPEIDGYTFVGWRSTNSASASVIQSLIAEANSQLTLYAIYSKMTMDLTEDRTSSICSGYGNNNYAYVSGVITSIYNKKCEYQLNYKPYNYASCYRTWGVEKDPNADNKIVYYSVNQNNGGSSKCVRISYTVKYNRVDYYIFNEFEDQTGSE